VSSGDWRSLAAGIELVATDLDGTLLRPDGTVSAFTVETFSRARAQGLPVVFVTGRPPRWMDAVVETTGHAGMAICANGACVVDLASRQVLEVFPLPHDRLVRVVDTLRAEVPGIAFAAEWAPEPGGRSFAHEHGYRARYPVEDAALGTDVRTLTLGHDVVKLLARLHDSDHDADSFLAHALAHVEHLVTVTHSNADDVLLEMSASGVSKGAALARLASDVGVPAARTAAVGDMPNDVPMLRWAGAGLAVSDAHRTVLAAADAVLPGPRDDGVALFVDAVLDPFAV
jgi:Cof subfamily protein (haloacid dehalogenase superfamily)